MKTDDPNANVRHLAELDPEDAARFKPFPAHLVPEIMKDPAVRHAEEKLTSASCGIDLLRKHREELARADVDAAVEQAARRLVIPHDPLEDRAIERDPRVAALCRKLAMIERLRRQAMAALATERVEAFYRLVRRRDAAAQSSGAVMPEDVRRHFSEMIDALGLAFVAGKLGVSPGLLERLVAGIPTPVGWTELPEEQPLAAE